MAKQDTQDDNGKHGNDDPSTHDASDDHGSDNPTTHDVGDDHGVDNPLTHDVGDDHGMDDPATHDVGDDHGVDNPATHDVGDDHSVDNPATHDMGDDHGVDNPATHDMGDDHGVDNPATHDMGDDHGGRVQLQLFVDRQTQQVIFTDDASEHARWSGAEDKVVLPLAVSVPDVASPNTVTVWRFHDAASDVYFWTADAALKDDLRVHHPEIQFDGAAFQAYADQASGGRTAIGLVWDRDFSGGAYGRFVYAPVDDAVQLAGQSTQDQIDYLGVAFWI